MTDADADFYWPNITIGSSLDAVRFAISNQNYILFSCFPVLNSYDPCGNINSLEKEWASEIYRAYNLGLVPIAGSLESLRIDDLLRIRTSDGGYYKISYDKISLFSTENVQSTMVDYDKKLLYSEVIDWFDVRSGGHRRLCLQEDEVINSIVSYPSSRIDGREYFDIFCVSHLTDEQLLDYNFSDTFMRFRIQKLAKLSGQEIDLSFWKRQVVKVFSTKLISAPPAISWRVDSTERHQ